VAKEEQERERVAISFSMKNGQKTLIDISLKKTYRWPIGT